MGVDVRVADRASVLADIVRLLGEFFPDRVDLLAPFVEGRIRKKHMSGMILVRVCKHLVIAKLPTASGIQTGACTACGLSWPRVAWEDKRMTRQADEVLIAKDGFRAAKAAEEAE